MAPRALRSGDRVVIRSKHEILASLGPDGTLDGLPFMPEMLASCGTTGTVHARAERVCDTITWGPQRRVRNGVFVAGIRCDGSSHGGCQAGCLVLWNERWLRRLDGQPDRGTVEAAASPVTGDVLTEETLVAAATRRHADGQRPELFMCQGTEMPRASTPMPWWGPAQYARDVTSGNASPVRVYIGLFRWVLARVNRLANGSKVPFMKGSLTRTPKELLDLQPGETVRIKTRREIERTLDRQNRNHGLTFDSEMLRYCGKEARVLRRIDRIIDERTGRLIHLRGDCIVLEDVVCTAQYHRLCPRSIYPYWREIWLSRVGQPGELAAVGLGANAPAAGASAQPAIDSGGDRNRAAPARNVRGRCRSPLARNVRGRRRSALLRVGRW